MALVNPRDLLMVTGPALDIQQEYLKIDTDLSTRDEYEATAYVAGYILKHIEILDSCNVCCANIFSVDNLLFKRNVDLALCASDQVVKLVDKVKQLLYYFLNSNAHLKQPLEDSFMMNYKEELNMSSQILSGLKTGVKSGFCSRNIGICAPCLQKATDPIQQLFVDKIREYKQKSGDGKKLVDPTADLEKELKTELEKVARQYGGAAGEDMTKFPTFKFPRPCY
ncbi:hypothetical protein NQ314_003844 [Rhamnusium bicolor]|uniref:ATP synthase-coupling factor 6, mitochondrial n=1 Tax=Rhamnusium bicolor TaxID=1586634 RepID=A0AAV8ZL44_9CUCU|nr:hypothetical protein NQ314_003844 [Rhamnusium bicolor]